MANIKFIAVSRSLSGILDYVTNREKTVERLISGVNCVAQTAQDEFEAVKKQFRKTDGRSYYHIVQAFAPDDPLDFDTAHEIRVEVCGILQGLPVRGGHAHEYSAHPQSHHHELGKF